MKKFLAIITMLMLLFTYASALAEAEPMPAETTETEAPAPEATETEAPAAEAPAEIKLEQHTMEDGFTFSIPKNWNYRELMGDETELGIFLQGYDLSANMTVTAIMESIDVGITPAMLADVMCQNTASFYTATVVKNDQGQELILFVTANGAGMGYIVIDPSGAMITFLFRHADDSIVIADEALAQLMAQCAQSVYFVTE